MNGDPIAVWLTAYLTRLLADEQADFVHTVNAFERPIVRRLYDDAVARIPTIVGREVARFRLSLEGQTANQLVDRVFQAMTRV